MAREVRRSRGCAAVSGEPLYNLRVNGPDRQQLLFVTGARDTVITAALNVIIDSAPWWQDTMRWPSPGFTIDVSQVTRA